MSFFIRALCTMYIRKFVYKHADATINYASCAYDILPSYGVNKDKIFVTYNTPNTESLIRLREKVLSAPPLLEKETANLAYWTFGEMETCGFAD